MAERPAGGHTFLLEVGCEEIPAQMIRQALEDLAAGIIEALGELGTPAEASLAMGGSRRLVCMLTGLPGRERDRDEVIPGPPRQAAFDADGRPTKAAEGFARKHGIAVGHLRVVQGPKGEIVAAPVHVPGRTAMEILSGTCPEVLGRMRFRKMMRWGDRGHLFVRPVHWIVALLDGQVVPFEFMGVASGRETRGHRFLGPGPHAIPDTGSYAGILLDKGRVEVRHEERRRLIAAAAAEAAAGAGGRLRPDEELLDELAFLTEHPAVICGSFPAEFLTLPEVVLVTAMRHHQKYLSVEDTQGRLMSSFVSVLTTDPDEAGLIRRGNEWVLKARLADARFFFEEDRKAPLSERVGALAGVTFHARLGSYADKSERVARILDVLAPEMGIAGPEREALRLAARLFKADLTTGMVGEFPELQGVVGGIYARQQGLPESCALAIEQHYRPSGSGDPVPAPGAPSALALADKLDTLALCFSAGLMPRGSADPYALRRAALGLLRILIESSIPADIGGAALRAALALAEPAAHAALDAPGDARGRGARAPEDPSALLADFLAQRLRFLMEESGVRFDAARAAIAAGWSPPLRAWRRARALNLLRGQEDFLALAAAAKRVRNILAQAEQKGIAFRAGSVSPADLVQPAERDLHEMMGRVGARAAELALGEDHGGALSAIASVRPAVDRFFDEVLVMDPDEGVRRNRLSLLADLSGLLSREADFAEVVVEGDTEG